jgi:hypothetical protein
MLHLAEFLLVFGCESSPSHGLGSIKSVRECQVKSPFEAAGGRRT